VSDPETLQQYLQEFAFGRRRPARHYFVMPLRGGTDAEEEAFKHLVEEGGSRSCYVMEGWRFSSEFIESYLDDFVHAADVVVGIGVPEDINSGIYFRRRNPIAHARDVGKRVVGFLKGPGFSVLDANGMREVEECQFEHIVWYESIEDFRKAVATELASELLYFDVGADASVSRPRLAQAAAAYEAFFWKKDIHHKDILALTSRQFEELVRDVWRRFGYDVEMTARTRDGGFDVVAMKDAEARVRFLIECKRYDPSNRVGVGLVRSLYGIKTSERATKAILATTSTFTSDARKFSDTHEWELELRDYEGVLSWISRVREQAK
jgi:Restriction endonuclease